MESARRALEDLTTWPGLTAAPACCGTGTAVLAEEVEIVHFHSGRQADLYLGRSAIERLSEELEQSTAVRVYADSPWVTVLLGGDSDADLLMTLTSLARQIRADRAAGSWASACNLGHISIIKAGRPA